jgi:hypothetical protein
VIDDRGSCGVTIPEGHRVARHRLLVAHTAVDLAHPFPAVAPGGELGRSSLLTP